MQTVRVNDRAEVVNEFKELHRAKTRDEAQLILNRFIDHWESKYPRMVRNLASTSNLLTFLEFPPSIRRTIYSTNIIESFNKKLKRKTKVKEQFPNESALDRFLATIILEYNEKCFGRAHNGFKQCQDTLESMF